MAVTLSGMVAFVGAGSVNESDLADDLGQAVDLLAEYLHHLRHVADDGTTTGIVATYTDVPEDTWTWADQRPAEEVRLVPVSILDRATEQVTAELFAYRNAPSGTVNTQFEADPAGSGPARLRRDPLTPAYALLGRWAVPF